MDLRQNPEHARVNEELPSDYEKIVREELLRAQERLAKLTPVGDAASLEPKIAAFRPGAPTEITITADRRPARKDGVRRGIIGFALAICIAGGAVTWQTPYGEHARKMIAAFTPQLGSTPQTERSGPPAQQQVAAADARAPQSPSTADAAQPSPPTAEAQQTSAAEAQQPQPGAAAPHENVVTPSPDLSASLQAIARDVGGLQQAVEQLKAGQDQMVRENAKVAEQLRASQEQMTRLLARASEHAAPKPAAAPPRRPGATLPPPQLLPPQAEQMPQVAAPPRAQADDLPIARPPKPVP